jgi:predicted Zn-dependent protease
MVPESKQQDHEGNIDTLENTIRANTVRGNQREEMNPVLDLPSFLAFVPHSRVWEAYVQGRRVIHVEYGNFGLAEPQLKLTPVNRWGARVTAFDAKERFIIEGNLDSEAQNLRAKALTASLPCHSPPPTEAHVLEEEVRPKVNPDSVSSEALWEKILTRLEWIIARLGQERYQVKVWCGWELRSYYDSLGSTMTSVFPLSKLKISVRLAENVLIKRVGAREGVEFFDGPQQTLMEDFLQDVQNAKVARRAKSISKVLVLDPEATAMLIHETMGHSSEGDNVLAGDSYLAALRGQRIAPSTVTILDSPKDYSSLGSYAFDDEGSLAQTTLLVKEGVVRGCLADRSVGAMLKIKSTGNCRSFWYDATPKVRMSNFVMLPCTRGFQDILAETEDGLLVKGMREGRSKDKTGEFHFKPNVAYRIANGELKEPVLISEIEDNAVDFLKAITDVSSEWSLSVAGCGKPTPQSDYVWVGYGAPFVKFEL